ncbi:uncharacterized protein MYCFIDRAFT_63656 [Pseudocercospora fijiensis CIRAD86]|uniref:NmrA-like domain-containing protein n=1 Tax=Pseudocercospora fijiensis (strain CIRAD86) TaxID=383855 RepID=M2ZS54_PSEFD|nr:uncharacterized protein MYCFIDRAFT_63656 [Pseudocercospora fijiensis CIRAD86]EME81864.1 hypothetical protein MYCFIDRAFT_63656 [Pseudocercospora fijiensis CIRAD86]
MRPLVVTGATGKQGGALITALLSHPSQPFEIYAVTRNKTSKSAQALAKNPNVHIIEGNFNDPDAIFSQVKSPWGLFAMSNPMNAAKEEEKEGKALVHAATNAGIQHIKRRQHGHFSPARSFLRNHDERFFLGKAFTAMWGLNGNDAKLQLVSTKDIGKIAAEAFPNAETSEYRNKSISLAGDENSVVEAEKVFREVTGQKIPETYGFVARILKWLLHEQLGLMFDWFRTEGFGVDVAELRKRYPYLKDFSAWLETESAWKKALDGVQSSSGSRDKAPDLCSLQS